MTHWIAFTRFGRWLDHCGERGAHDVSLVDEVFGVFAGVTLSVALVVDRDWGDDYWYLAVAILAVVALTLVVILVAINQTRLTRRLLFYGLALMVGLLGNTYVVWLSRNDLRADSGGLGALIIGGILWVVVRESAILLLNALPENTNGDDT